MLTWLISKYFLCLVEEFDSKFSIKILEKAFYALRASFLWEHKKYQKEGKLPNEVRNSTKACCSRKTSQRPVKNSIYGATDKICCRKIAAFFCCVWMKNAACGTWALVCIFLFCFYTQKKKIERKTKHFCTKFAV